MCFSVQAALAKFPGQHLGQQATGLKLRGWRCRSPFENSIEAPTGIAGPSFEDLFLRGTPRDLQVPELLRLIGTLVGEVDRARRSPV